MCTCASCEYTDGFSGKSFADWPRGEPAGKRASDASYMAHVSHLWEGVRRHVIAFELGQAPIYPSIPGLVHPVQRNAVAVRWNAGRKASPVLPELARPAQPGKAEPHFPALDRQRETVISIAQTIAIHSSANDSEEAMAAKYMTVAQAAETWSISEPRIRQWLQHGRIKGAQKVGRDWLIPANAERPAPARPGELIRARKQA